MRFNQTRKLNEEKELTFRSTRKVNCNDQKSRISVTDLLFEEGHSITIEPYQRPSESPLARDELPVKVQRTDEFPSTPYQR